MICYEIADVSHVGNPLKTFHPNHNVVVLECKFFSFMNRHFVPKFELCHKTEPVTETSIVVDGCWFSIFVQSEWSNFAAEYLLFLHKSCSTCSGYFTRQHVMIAHPLVDAFQTCIKPITFAETVFIFAIFASVLFPVKLVIGSQWWVEGNFRFEVFAERFREALKTMWRTICGPRAVNCPLLH